jgi:S-formylglutathione hydrolase FrmB
MKSARWLAVIAVTGLLFSPIRAAQAQEYPGRITELKVASQETDFPIRTVYVWTPPVPTSQIQNLPVVYMLHGWPGGPKGIMAATIKELATEFKNGAKPFIAVYPDGNALTHIDSEWADSYDGKAMVETWLTKNVIQAVEGKNIRPKSNRAILGFSMGGYGAAIVGLHHPDLYSQVITLAGYFVSDDLTNAYGGIKNEPAKVAYQTPNHFLNYASQIRWFLGESPQDLTALIRGQAAAWGAKLKAKKANYVVSSAPGGHSYQFVSGQMKPITKWLTWGPFTGIPTDAASPSPSASN